VCSPALAFSTSSVKAATSTPEMCSALECSFEWTYGNHHGRSGASVSSLLEQRMIPKGTRTSAKVPCDSRHNVAVRWMVYGSLCRGICDPLRSADSTTTRRIVANTACEAKNRALCHDSKSGCSLHRDGSRLHANVRPRCWSEWRNGCVAMRPP
jgi:hypothetical protein